MPISSKLVRSNLLLGRSLSVVRCGERPEKFRFESEVGVNAVVEVCHSSSDDAVILVTSVKVAFWSGWKQYERAKQRSQATN